MVEAKLLFFGLAFLSCGGYSQCQDDGIVRLFPNVALRGTATQSVTHVNPSYVGSPFVASHANDGNFDRDLLPNTGECAYTKNTPPVWWQVDLLEVYEISKVAITNRNQAIMEGNIYIDVSNSSDGSSAQQCAHDPKMFDKGETRVYPCPCGMYGRYVRIRYPIDQRSYLILCEVQIQSGGYCPEPEQLDNAERTVPATQYETGTNITYTCNECYTGGGTSTCQCNGDWTPVDKCTIQHCSDPESIENGRMEGSAPFTCVSKVKYTCNEGYWLLGADTLRCRINGHWDHGKPRCIDKNQDCGEPPKIGNAQRFGSKTEVTYQCDECYTGGGSGTCWNGEWSHEGSCSMVPCDDVPDVQYSKRIPSEDSVMCGTKVRYTCNEGLTLHGDSVLECVAGGELLGQMPFCRGSGVTLPESEDNTEEEEKNNDSLVLGLGATGFLLAGIIITLVTVFLCRRKGLGPCARVQPNLDHSQVNQDYEQPKDLHGSLNTEDDSNDHYMELDDPKSPEYENQVSD